MSKIRRLFHLQGSKMFSNQKRVLLSMSQKIMKISNLTESYEGDMVKKKQQKEYWCQMWHTPNFGRMSNTSSKLSTVGSWLIIGEFWTIIHVRLFIKCLSIYSICEDFCGISVTLGTAPTLIWMHLAFLLMKQGSWHTFQIEELLIREILVNSLIIDFELFWPMYLKVCFIRTMFLLVTGLWRQFWNKLRSICSHSGLYRTEVWNI